MVKNEKTNPEIAEYFGRSILSIQYAMRKYKIFRLTKIKDLENEIWEDVPGYEGSYQVSNYGRIKSLPRYVLYSDGREYFYDGVLLKQKHDHGGYCCVELTKNSKLETFKVHRLVASVFIPNPNNLPQINHKDENKDNNRVENLEWCDSYYNNNYGTKKERIELNRKDRKPIILTDMTTGEKHYCPSISDAIRTFNLDPRTIQRCLKKEPYFKTIKGYMVEYA